MGNFKASCHIKGPKKWKTPKKLEKSRGTALSRGLFVHQVHRPSFRLSSQRQRLLLQHVTKSQTSFPALYHGSTGKKEGFVCLCNDGLQGVRLQVQHEERVHRRLWPKNAVGKMPRLRYVYVWYIAVAPDPTHKIADR